MIWNLKTYKNVNQQKCQNPFINDHCYKKKVLKNNFLYLIYYKKIIVVIKIS